MSSVGLGLSVDLGLTLVLVRLLVSVLSFLGGLRVGNDGAVLLQVVIGGSVGSLLTPVIKLVLVLDGLHLSGGRALRCLLRVDLGLGLE